MLIQDGIPGYCCPEKKAQRGDLVGSLSELATEGEERSVRSSRTPREARTQELHVVVASWVGAVS